jgi:hypothetical protein
MRSRESFFLAEIRTTVTKHAPPISVADFKGMSTRNFTKYNSRTSELKGAVRPLAAVIQTAWL